MPLERALFVRVVTASVILDGAGRRLLLPNPLLLVLLVLLALLVLLFFAATIGVR